MHRQHTRALLGGLFTLAILAAPAAAASSRMGVSAGYDSEADGEEGDGWIAANAGHTLALAKEGRFTASLDVAAGAVAFARLTDLDRLWAEVRPEAGFVLSPRVDARLALFAEARLVEDDARSSLGWGAAVKLRERITGDLDVTEYVSWRDLRARDDAFSESTLALGCSLFTFLGERWSLGAGLELGLGGLGGATPGEGGTGGMGGMGGAGMHRAAAGQALGPGGGGMGGGMGGGSGMMGGDDTLAASLSAGHDWSDSLSSFVEYVATFGLEGGGTGHAVTAGTAWRF